MPFYSISVFVILLLNGLNRNFPSNNSSGKKERKISSEKSQRRHQHLAGTCIVHNATTQLLYQPWWCDHPSSANPGRIPRSACNKPNILHSLILFYDHENIYLRSICTTLSTQWQYHNNRQRRMILNSLLYPFNCWQQST